VLRPTAAAYLSSALAADCCSVRKRSRGFLPSERPVARRWHVPPDFDLDNLADALADRLAERFAALAQRRYMSVADAAAYTSLSTDAIRCLLARTKLTAYRPIAGRVLIDRLELDALMASSTRRPRRGRGVYTRSTPAAESSERKP
jgi:excisionase family DNA binding protein